MAQTSNDRPKIGDQIKKPYKFQTLRNMKGKKMSPIPGSSPSGLSKTRTAHQIPANIAAAKTLTGTHNRGPKGLTRDALIYCFFETLLFVTNPLNYNFLRLGNLLERLQTLKQILLRVKLNVPVVGRRIQIIGELHEVPVDFSVMGADNVALMVFDRSHTK